MKVTSTFALTLSAAAALALTACTPYQQQGAAVGGLAGAGLGALSGDSGDVVRGAALGAALGAGGAAVKEEYDRRNGQAAPQPQPRPVQPAPRPSAKYPAATRTANPNHVISPYPPHNVIDVTGFNAGDLARDKTTGKIFTVPAR